jgi:glycerol-3-phosphate acyltransferase PlsX
MDESPVAALKKKKDASLFQGLRLLKEKKIDAFISAGNTGALVLGAKRILSTISPFKRPAFLSILPTKKRPVAILDLGANFECKSNTLVQFAHMAAKYLRVYGIPLPRIGLLNIGEESIKGPQELRLAYKKLQATFGAPFQFVGNIEGNTVFEGNVDAVITDGFTGNVFLKTAEGVAEMILEKSPQENFPHIHFSALLLGVQGLVIKCHGKNSPQTFLQAVEKASEWVQIGLLEKFI